MSTSLALYELTALKEALQTLLLSRQQIEVNLGQMQELLEEIDNQPPAEAVPVSLPDRQNELQQKVDDLNSLLAEKDRRIDAILGQRDDLHSQLEEKNRHIEMIMRERDSLFRQIKRAAFEGPRTIYHVLGLDNEYPLDKLGKRIDELESEHKRDKRRIEDLEEQRAILDQKISDLDGALNRSGKEKERLIYQLQQAGPEARIQLLVEFIGQIGSNRLAGLLEEDLSVEEIEKEKLKTAERVLYYLRSALHLRVTHPKGSQANLTSEEFVSTFELDEPFEEVSLYVVTSPGFCLEDKIVVKAKIQRIGEDPNANY